MRQVYKVIELHYNSAFWTIKYVFIGSNYICWNLGPREVTVGWLSMNNNWFIEMTVSRHTPSCSQSVTLIPWWNFVFLVYNYIRHFVTFIIILLIFVLNGKCWISLLWINLSSDHNYFLSCHFGLCYSFYLSRFFMNNAIKINSQTLDCTRWNVYIIHELFCNCAE